MAGTTKLINDGTNNTKNSKNSTVPFCHTISVVISPNGLNAPPAFAATTILTKAIEIKRTLLPPTAITTAPIIRAVVKLSAIGEIKNAKKPVSQNNCLNENPLLTNQTFNDSKTSRSRMASM
ncbi:hypothetical protein MNB_SUP05-SYMBIONT-5-1196 [hydrothermal vent metagenome]|uniref:Uncharacterized protein n=1 Tax=hydrothermal vent metagenome TaxID=652676 RepID=A0A1W1E0S9_9ZZZZ